MLNIDYEVVKKRGRNPIEYVNLPIMFDIESTSTYVKEHKFACMYAWGLGISDKYYTTGRTWEEFIHLCEELVQYFNLHTKRRIIIYVHNLAFEFQFFRKYFEWEKVFALDVRKVVYTLTSNGIEFRCSYILSGYSLEKLGDKLNFNKLVGDLDYSKVRHYKTDLSIQEWEYIKRDVDIGVKYISEKIKEDGDITKILLTKTSYVRKYCRDNCMKGPKYKMYKNFINNLRLTDKEYLQLKRAFQGGFVHANAIKSGEIIDDVDSWDLCSSYPSVMVCEKFPMSTGTIYKIKDETDFREKLENYCCLFDIKLENVKLKDDVFDSPISVSRCISSINVIEDNGRVYKADSLIITVTELDFKVYEKFYNWDNLQIANFRIYKKSYLPTDLVKSILKLYVDKTTLKDVKGQEYEYGISKEFINSTYGMIVTDIVRDDIEYIEDWSCSSPDVKEKIDEYNEQQSRFLFYPWGVWVTAYARYNVFSAIYNIGEDYIYSDTDSVKFENAHKHLNYFNRYNKVIANKHKQAMLYHNLDYNKYIEPKTKDGVKKVLGVWEHDGSYRRFKTLGAKRYIFEDTKNKLNVTVSGIKKRSLITYLENNSNDIIEMFNKFNNSLNVSKIETGKNTHTYIDNELMFEVTDYLGNSACIYEKSSVHLESVEFTLSLSDKYINFLTGIKELQK